MKLISLTLLFCFFSSLVFAGFEFNDNCKQAYEEIVKLRFEAGRKLLEKERELHPENNIPVYLENYIDFFTIIIDEDEAEFEKLKNNKDERLEVLEKGDENSPYYLFSQAEVQLQWAFSRIKFGEYLNAAFEINKAYKLLERNSERFPDFVPNKKSLGLLHALIGTIPDNYKWAVNIFGVEGTIQQGVHELNAVIKHCNQPDAKYAWLKTETLFLLTFIELNLHKDDENIEKLYREIKKVKEYQPLLTFAKASIAIETGKNDEAIELLENRPEITGQSTFHYLDFLTGEAKMNRLDVGADTYFEKYLEEFPGNSYRKAANQKLAWYHFAYGDTSAYRNYMKQLQSVGSTFLDEDKQAQKEAESGELPNIKLLKARILFDGGYHFAALKALIDSESAKDFKTEKDQLEFTYRLARIHHKMGNLKDAISYYKMTIENGGNSEYYFPANAALQLGLIYEEKGEKDTAEKYFKKCFEFKKHEYRNSINQKAKAGLNRLEGN